MMKKRGIFMIISDWICEFCYKPCNGRLPDEWILIFGSACCPDCKAKVQKDGGFNVVRGGAYAYCEDPRAIWGELRSQLPFAAVAMIERAEIL